MSSSRRYPSRRKSRCSVATCRSFAPSSLLRTCSLAGSPASADRIPWEKAQSDDADTLIVRTKTRKSRLGLRIFHRMKTKLEIPGYTEANAAVTAARIIPTPGSRSELVHIAVPGPTTNNPAAAIASSPRSAIAGGRFIAFVPAVLDPFPNVSVHVEQAELVWTKRAHGCCI